MESPNIMVIDDESDMLFTFRSFLAEEGYTIEEFTDSKQALQYIEDMNPSYYDLVITDNVKSFGIRIGAKLGLPLQCGILTDFFFFIQ